MATAMERLRKTLDTTMTTKADLSAWHGARPMVPIVEYHRDGELVAVVHAGGHDNKSSVLPLHAIALGAIGWRADEVRVVVEVAMHTDWHGTPPPPGELQRRLADDPFSGVTHGLHAILLQRELHRFAWGVPVCLSAAYDYTELDQPGAYEFTEHGVPSQGCGVRFGAVRFGVDPASLTPLLAVMRRSAAPRYAHAIARLAMEAMPNEHNTDQRVAALVARTFGHAVVAYGGSDQGGK